MPSCADDPLEQGAERLLVRVADRVAVLRPAIRGARRRLDHLQLGDDLRGDRVELGVGLEIGAVVDDAGLHLLLEQAERHLGDVVLQRLADVLADAPRRVGRQPRRLGRRPPPAAIGPRAAAEEGFEDRGHDLTA